MKKQILPILALVFLLAGTTQAQVRVNLNLNIGSRPAWGLPGNYTGDYYYFPEIDAYYCIPEQRFIYLDAGRWVFGAQLPYAYRNYDLYRGYKVVINEPRPYMRGQFYRERYGRGVVAYRPPVVVVDRRGDRDHWDDRRNDRRRDDDRWDNRRDERRDDHRGRGRW
jgi:hypothetical protein